MIGNIDWTGQLSSITRVRKVGKGKYAARTEPDNDRDVKLTGWLALAWWLVVGVTFAYVVAVWFGALVFFLAMRHVWGTFPRPVAAAPVEPVEDSISRALAESKAVRKFLCEDCVWTELTGQPKDGVAGPRLKRVLDAHLALKETFPTWVEDEGPDSLVAESSDRCGCCGTTAKGARVAFFLS